MASRAGFSFKKKGEGEGTFGCNRSLKIWRKHLTCRVAPCVKKKGGDGKSPAKSRAAAAKEGKSTKASPVPAKTDGEKSRGQKRSLGGGGNDSGSSSSSSSSSSSRRSSSGEGTTGRRGTESSPATSASKRVKTDERTSVGGARNSGNSEGRKSTGASSSSTSSSSSASSSSSSSSKRTEASLGAATEGAKERDAGASEKKAHYPRIEYDPRTSKAIFPSRAKSPSSAAGKSNKDVLVQLVEEICAVESVGLKEYSESEHGGRDGIMASLRGVLADVPTRVAEEVDDDIVCLPELTSAERSDVEALQAMLATLKDQTAELARYEGDVSELGKVYDVWLDSANVEKAERPRSSSGSRRGGGGGSGAGSDALINVTAETQRYDQLLADIEARCKGLVQDADDAAKVMTDARVAQDELYKTYQNARLKVQLGTKDTQINVPNDAKAIIRNFPKAEEK